MPSYFRTINIDSPVYLDDSFVERAEEILTRRPETLIRETVSAIVPRPSSRRFSVYSRILDSPFKRPSVLGSPIYTDKVDTCGLTAMNNNPLFHDRDWMLSDCRYIAEFMLILLQMIEIRLRKSPHIIERTPTKDYLGMYISSSSVQRPPYIELFPEEIEKCANTCGIPGMSKERLAAFTLIHELAHAFLDPCNHGHEDKYSDDYRHYFHPFKGVSMLHGWDNFEDMNFYHVREESMANVITSRIYKLGATYAESLAVNKFIQIQPAHYRLALDLLKTPRIAGWLRLKEEFHLPEADAKAWMDNPSNNDLGLPWDEEFDFKKYNPRYKTSFNKYGDSLAEGYHDADNPIQNLFSTPDTGLHGYRGEFLLYDDKWNLRMVFPKESLIVLDGSTILYKDERIGWRTIHPDGTNAIMNPFHGSDSGVHYLDEMKLFIPEARKRFCPLRILVYNDRDQWAIVDRKFNVLVDFNDGKVPEEFPYC